MKTRTKENTGFSVASATLLLVFVSTYGVGTISAFDVDQVRKDLQQSVECRGTPGMAVAVVKDGKVLYSDGFGVSNLDTKTPVTPDTLFGIASISKSFAAALLLKQMNEGTNLTLDSKVREFLGDQFVLADEERTYESTFVDLLAHRTALLANNRIRLDENFKRDTLLGRLRYLPSNKQFRSDFIYNNLVYGLVSRMAEMMAGDGTSRWEELVTQQLFQPLGMKSSTFATRVDFTRDDFAPGYVDIAEPGKYERVDPELSRKWAELCGSGSVVSSANEMVKWMNFHMDGGKNENGDSVMSESLVKELHKKRMITTRSSYMNIDRPQFPVTADIGYYSLGLRTGHYRGYDVISHTGSTWGYTAVMFMLPTEKTGVVILRNSGDSKFLHRAAVLYYLVDRVLGLDDPWVNATHLCTFPEPWVKKEDLPKPSRRPQRDPASKLRFPGDQYKGVYENKGFGKMVIDFNATNLNPLTGTYGWGSWELFPHPWPQESSSNNKTKDDDDNNDGEDDDASKNTEESFYGQGLGVVKIFDIRPVSFITHPKTPETIVGLRAGFMDRNVPPVFCKKEHLDACREMEASSKANSDAKSSYYCPQTKGNNSTIVQCCNILNVCMTLLLLFRHSFSWSL